MKAAVAQPCPTLCDPMDCSPPGSLSMDSPGKITGVGCHSLFQGIFPTQGLNLVLLNCRQILYHLSHHGSPTFDDMCITTNQDSKHIHPSSKFPFFWEPSLLPLLVYPSRQQPICSWSLYISLHFPGFYTNRIIEYVSFLSAFFHSRYYIFLSIYSEPRT